MRFRAVRTAGNSSGGALIGWMAQSALMRRGASLGGLRGAFLLRAVGRRATPCGGFEQCALRMPPYRESIANYDK